MTQEDIDATAGRTRRELREAKTVLAALNAKAAQVKEFSQRLSKALDNPSGLVIDNQPYEIEYTPIGSTAIFSSSDFVALNPEKLRELSDDLRQQAKNVSILRKRLIELEGEE